MQSPEFAIPTHELDASGKPFHFVLRSAWLRGALEDCDLSPGPKDGLVDVRASKSGNDVIVRGHFEAEVVVPCARCLKPTTIHLNQPITAIFVPAGAVKGSKGMDDEYEFSPEEAELSTYDGETVVLDSMVRDEIALEIPMIPLCSETCPGMSAELEGAGTLDGAGGEDRTHPVDPRLAPLLRFKNRNETKKE